MAAAYADALAMAWGRCGPVASMAHAVKMKAESLSSSRELEEAAVRRMQTADPLRDTGLGAVIAAAKKVGGTDPQAVARADAALALEAAVRVRRPEIIEKALDKLRAFGMHEDCDYFAGAAEIHKQLHVAASLRTAITSRQANAEDIDRWVAAARDIDAVSKASRGVPVGVVRFDTSLGDIPKVLVELCSVGGALANLLRADSGRTYPFFSNTASTYVRAFTRLFYIPRRRIITKTRSTTSVSSQLRLMSIEYVVDCV